MFYAIDNKASDCSHRIKQTSQAPEFIKAVRIT